MKALAIGCACLMAGGTFLSGAFNRADAVRIVNLPVEKVYGEFADAMQPEGPSDVPFRAGPDGERRTVHISVDKVRDKSVGLHADLGDRRIFSLDLRFEPIQDGAATRILADTDIDATLFKEISGGDTPPQVILDMNTTRATKVVLDKAVDDLEHGRHLTPSRLGGGSRFYAARNDAVEGARTSRPGDLRSAAAPMQTARPMISPNEVARQHMMR